MKVTLCGTGTPLPDPNRAGPATLVEAGATTLMVDAGRGALMRLVAAGVLPLGLDAVLLTHLHSDHICSLNDVVSMHWTMSSEPTPLKVYGPARTQEMADGLLAMLGPDISFRLAHHDDLTWEPIVEVEEVLAGDHFEVGEAAIMVGRTNHAPVEPSVAFRVEHEGVVAVLGGDGVPCDELDELCDGADAYVQTVMREDLVRLVPSERFLDILDYHSTVQDAARTAARAGVARLVLTHYIPSLPAGQEDEWRALAAEHFEGEIVVGDDLTVVEF